MGAIVGCPQHCRRKYVAAAAIRASEDLADQGFLNAPSDANPLAVQVAAENRSWAVRSMAVVVVGAAGIREIVL